MLINPSRDERPVHEIRDPRKFRRVVESRPGQRVEVVIQAAGVHPFRPGEPGPWWDVITFWEGPADQWEQNIPSELVLEATGLQVGAAFVKPVVRAVI